MFYARMTLTIDISLTYNRAVFNMKKAKVEGNL